MISTAEHPQTLKLYTVVFSDPELTVIHNAVNELFVKVDEEKIKSEKSHNFHDQAWYDRYWQLKRIWTELGEIFD